MPTFELEGVGPGRYSGVVRARDFEDAVRRAPEFAGGQVAVGAPAGPDDWREVLIDGASAGRVRPHQRMRFRRD